MKSIKISFLLLGLLVFVTSCSDNEDLYMLSGEWQLTEVSGGFGGGGYEVDGDLIVDIQGNKLQAFINNSLGYEGNISYGEEEYYEYIEFDPKITDQPTIFSGEKKKFRIVKDNNTFILTELCFDCYSYHFTKR